MRLFRLGFRLSLAVVAVAAVYFGVTFAQVWQASRADDSRPAEAIVVLGAAQYDGRPSPVLQARLDHAYDLYEQGLAPVIMLTGGRRPGDRRTEAAAALGYLIGRGVPESSTLLAPEGENSWQSLGAAARVLRQRELDRVVLVSSPYHALRITQISDELGLDGASSPTRTSPESLRSRVVHLAREAVAVGIGRVIGYDRLVRLDQVRA